MGAPENSVAALTGSESPAGRQSVGDAKAIESDHCPPPVPPKQQSQQHPLSAIPKRKPVPQATVVAVADDDSAEVAPNTSLPRQEFRVGKFAIPIPFAGNRRKQCILGGIVGGVILAALIIGLAVGLTVKKNASSNLPLPTSHGGPYSGDLTYYTPALGSCGITSSSDEEVCAVSHYIFDAASVGSDPNANPLCGLKIRLKREEKSVDVTVVDRCVGCEATDIDVSESVFADLAAMELGRVDVHWAWLQDAPVVMP